MNIKNLISSQRIRHKILKCFFWVPDRIMVPIQYWIILKRWPNLKNPKRFSEWIQWYKIYYRNPVLMQCVDKYKVRAYVESKMESSTLLNKLYQVCDVAQEINFNFLPSKFVIKTTDGGSGDNVLICKDKSSLDIHETIQKINSWRDKKYYVISREWAYTGAKKSQIIIEEYLENEDNSLDDYKFYCYNGKFRFLDVDKGRFENHQRAWYDEQLKFIPNITGNYKCADKPFKLPSNINEMIKIAEKFASDFPFVRVDLYNIDGVIRFGELTFYPMSGYGKFNPDTFDFELGKYMPNPSEI